MAEQVIEVAVKVLVEKLIALAAKEIGVVKDFKNELKTLQESLKMIQGFVEDASKKCIEDDQAVKQWLQDLEDVAYQADNLLDEFNYELIRRKVYQMKLKVCCSSSSCVAFSRKMGHKIKDVNEKLKSINERATSFGLQQRLAVSAVSVPLVLETNSKEVDPIFIGRNDVYQKSIHDMINSSNELVISVAPIVGMGGLGKTTLARNIFNHQSVANHFSTRIWVSLSKIIDKKGLLMQILESLSKQSVSPSLKEETVLEQLQYKLKDARYLLVLDDFLNLNDHEWDSFMSCMMGISPSRGNFIIITTRNKDVASIATTHETVTSLQGLSDDDCWSIIKARTFPSQQVPQDFEAIGKEIAHTCQGLPLAANVVGGSLRGKGIDDWMSFRHESGFSKSGPKDDFVLLVLKISYDRLPSSLLKNCFAYCSIFPKGEELNRERLIQLWMAEGLLFGNSDGNVDQMEILGDKFYNILLQNFFLHEPIMDKYGRIKYSKMHDFVHDLSCLVEKAKPLNAEDVTCRVRYLPANYYEHDVQKEQTNCLETLFLLEGKKFIYTMFRDCKYLRVLDLQRTSVREITSSISKLIHLRFLDLSHTYIRNLPDSICELFHLHTLRLIGCDYLRKFPDRLKLLAGLRHLAFSSFIQRICRMPAKIGNLTSLRTLTIFVVSHKKGCKINELGYLKNLRGKLRIFNLDKVSDKKESERARLSEKKNLEILKFEWGVSSRKRNNNDHEVLEGLQPHPHLKGLTIKNFAGDRFPSWTLNMTVEPGITLQKLIKIVLIGCHGCKEIPNLGHLPLLKILWVHSLRSVRSIGPSFYCEDESGRYGVPFPSLERLTLQCMDSLSGWVEAPNTAATAFPRLEYLEIEDCCSMTIGPSHDFPSLKTLSIRSFVKNKVPLAKMCEKVRSLERLKIKKISDVTSDLVEIMLQNNQHLQELSILECDNLTQLRLPDTLKSLRLLTIESCYNLASIQNLKALSALQCMIISYCKKLTELQDETLESSTSLEVLNITSCVKLRSIPKATDRLNKLRHLSIGPLAEETGLSLFNEALRGLHQLGGLKLYGHRNCESLPDQLQHLTALIDLTLDEFGIEALPEWFSNLSSLERLTVYRCKKLNDVTCLKHLTRLKTLIIYDAILLNQSRIPEISHVNRVEIFD